ncbi:unnamed protein product, partial [Scytosiphon promiscuus]
ATREDSRISPKRDNEEMVAEDAVDSFSPLFTSEACIFSRRCNDEIQSVATAFLFKTLFSPSSVPFRFKTNDVLHAIGCHIVTALANQGGTITAVSVIIFAGNMAFLSHGAQGAGNRYQICRA